MVTLKESEQSAKAETHAGSADHEEVADRVHGEPGRRHRKRDQNRAKAKNRAKKAGRDSGEDDAPTKSKTKRRQRRRRLDGEVEQPVTADPDSSESATKPDRKRRKKRKRAKHRDIEGGLEEYREKENGLADEAETPEEADSDARGGRRPLISPVATAVLAANDQQNEKIFVALQRAFRGSQIELISAATNADLVIAFADGAGSFSQTRGKSATVFVGNPIDAGSHALCRAAKTEGSLFLSLAPLLRRYGAERVLDGNVLGGEGIAVVAANIRQGLERAGKLSGGTPGPAALDFTEAMKLSKTPAEILKTLSWTEKAPPGAMGARYSAKIIEQFLDGDIGGKARKSHASDRSRRSRREPARGGAAEDPFDGLDAVSNLLTYWFAKANGVSSSRTAPIDDMVKVRGLTASALLARARDIILRCIGKGAALPLPAWRHKSLKRGARAFELFLLCCRMAAFRRIKFDETACGPVFVALIEILERVRPAALSSLGSGEAVAEAVTLAGLALPLRKTPFGAILLNDVLESLRLYQLELGISPDGVWQEGFADHASVLTDLTTLIGDLRDAEVPSRPFAGIMTNLANFVDAFLTEDGSCPPIAELAPVSYRGARAAARSILKTRMQGPSRESFLFQDEGFFISRSPGQSGRPLSHLVLHARRAMFGGPSLSFSARTRDLLIGGGAAGRKVRPEVCRCALEEPAAHNAVRVNGLTYPQAQVGERPGISIGNTWQENNWAAARILNGAFEPVKMVRTVVHLKPYCAILIVDEIFGDAVVKCEQFWHLGPGLQLQQRAPLLLCFAVPDGGNLSVAFDSPDAVEIASGNDRSQIGWTATAEREVVSNPYLRRERRGQSIVMGSLFRWSNAPANLAVAVEPLGGGWKATARGGAAGVGFVYRDDQLKLIA